MKIGICGNIPLDSLAQELDQLRPGSDIIVGRIDAFQDELSHPQGDFTSLDICIIALDWQQLVPELFLFAFGDDVPAALTRFRQNCDELKKCLEKFRVTSAARLLVFSPVCACSASAGFIDRLLPTSFFELWHDCQKLFNELCRFLPDIYPVDLEELSSCLGRSNAFDTRLRQQQRQPFSPAFTRAIAAHISKICTQFQKYPLKCLVLDCDNTLWGGIVGEDGGDNLVIGNSGPGAAFQEFQAEIVRLHRQGVILAICSKNNTCDVLDVLEKHPQMLIRPKMISSFRITWDDKPKNVLEISRELKIGLDAMLFVDDNSFERAMMRAALPDVEILDLPDDPAYFADTLRKNWRFWPVQITKDDAVKGAFFVQERLRKQSQEIAANIQEYLVNSRITLTVRRADEATLPRITQLFNKTNQFNLTTIRYSQSELLKKITEAEGHLFYASLADAYGDYGIIAAALIVKDTIDSFLLSCRAFGKQVETAVLIVLLDFLRHQGAPQVYGRYIASPKNSLTKDFYRENGFILVRESSGQSTWRFDLKNDIKEVPRWITVIGTLYI